VHRFRAAVNSVRRCDDPARTAAVLAEALALWRGPLLGDVATERLRSRLGAGLEELRLTAVEDCAQAELDAGRPDRTITMLAGSATDFPVRERAVALLMRAYASTGRTAEALAVYRSVRQIMVDELGLEPGADLQHVHEAVLHGDEPPAPPAGSQPSSPAQVFRPLQLPPDLAASSAGRMRPGQCWKDCRGSRVARFRPLLPSAECPASARAHWRSTPPTCCARNTPTARSISISRAMT